MSAAIRDSKGSAGQQIVNFLSCRRGASAAEAALVLPLLTMMILGVFEYGAVIYSYSKMQFGVNRVARTIAINRMSGTAAQNEVRRYVPGWARSSVTVSVAQSAPADPNTNLIIVQARLPAQKAAPLALLTRIAPWQLATNVTIKQELPYVD